MWLSGWLLRAPSTDSTRGMAMNGKGGYRTKGSPAPSQASSPCVVLNIFLHDRETCILLTSFATRQVALDAGEIWRLRECGWAGGGTAENMGFLYRWNPKTHY